MDASEDSRQDDAGLHEDAAARSSAAPRPEVQLKQSNKSIIDQTTKSSLIFLLVMAFGFIYDQRVSEAMHALGYNTGIVSNIWFIRNEHAFLAQTGLANDLSPDPFHIFELFVWIAIAINLVRIVRGTISPPIEQARFTLAKRKMTVLGYFLRWVFAVPGGFLLSMFAMPLFAIGGSSRLLLSHSPKAFIFIFASLFAMACFLCADGLLIFFGLISGKRVARRMD